MIIRSKAPLRLGLAGGGSDVSPYCDIYGGLVLNTTINLYAYCTIEETEDDCITICSYDADVNKSYILREAWENKKRMAKHITNPMIQEAMDTAINAGAKAGKVSGAGGGGFIMFVVEPTRKKEVEQALSKLDGFVMPFNFSDGGAHGWKIYDTDNIKAF